MDQKSIPQSEGVRRFNKVITPVLSRSKESRVSGFPGFTSSANSEVSYYKDSPHETASSSTIYRTSPSSCYSSCTTNSSGGLSKYYSVNSSVVSHQSHFKSSEHSDLFFCNSEVLRIKQELLELERNKRRTKRIIEQLKHQMDAEERVLHSYSSEKCLTSDADTLHDDSSNGDTLQKCDDSSNRTTMHITIDNWADTVCKENPGICQSLEMTSFQLNPVSSGIKACDDIHTECGTEKNPSHENCLRDCSFCIATMKDCNCHLLNSNETQCDSEGNENELKDCLGKSLETLDENDSVAKFTDQEEPTSEESTAEMSLNANNIKGIVADTSHQASEHETCVQRTDGSSVVTDEIQTEKEEHQTEPLAPSQHTLYIKDDSVSTSSGSNSLSSTSKQSTPSCSDDIEGEGEKPLMEAIIDCSSDSINTFLNGFLLSKRSREQLAHAFLRSYGAEHNKNWIRQIETFRKKAGDKSSENFRNSARDSFIENFSKKSEGKPVDAKSAIEHDTNEILIESESSGHASQEVPQECGYDVGYVESPSFPELVGAWSGTTVSKSLSQSSCRGKAKEKTGITLSMSSDSIKNVPREPSDITLAIRRRLNLLSLINPTPIMPTLTKCHMNTCKGRSSSNNQQSGLEAKLSSGSRSLLKCSTAESITSHGRSKRKRRARRILRSVLESESSLQSLANDAIIASKQQATVKTSSLNTRLDAKPEKGFYQAVCSSSEKDCIVKGDGPIQDESLSMDVQNKKRPTFSGIWKQISGNRVDAVTQVDIHSPLMNQNDTPSLEHVLGNGAKKIYCTNEERRRSQLQLCSDSHTKPKPQTKICNKCSSDVQKNKVKVKLPEQREHCEKLKENNTASTEQIYRDLHGHSSGRVKVEQNHLRNAVKRKLLSFTKKHSSIL